MESLVVLISCFYHSVFLRSPLYVWNYFRNRVEFEMGSTFFQGFSYFRNCFTPTYNKLLIQSCQFAVALD